MPTVIIPTPLRKFTNNAAKVSIHSLKVSDAVIELSLSFPALKRYLVNTDGRIASFINIFIDEKDIRNLDHEETKFRETAVLSIVPAIAGGNPRSL